MTIVTAIPKSTASPSFGGINPGYFAVFTTLLIWAGFFISLRAGAKSVLTSADLALIRFGVPALFLSGLAWRRRDKILATPKRYLLGILCGAGLPFFFISATAMQYAPVAHGSTLVPGTLPLFVTAIAILFYKESLSRHRAWGLTLNHCRHRDNHWWFNDTLTANTRTLARTFVVSQR